MYNIHNMKNYSGGLERGINFYHKAWGNRDNYLFFKDAIVHSKTSGIGPEGIPRFYVLVKNDTIIGCCGLITSDFVSRGDLYPWFAGLYIDENERGRGLGGMLLKHTEQETRQIGFNRLYLITSLENFYEKYGWERIENGYELSGKEIRIYTKKTM